MVLGVISGWCRFSGEKQGSCARSMDVIPAGMGDAETLPEEQLGPMAMPVPPLCAPKAPRTGGAVHSTRTQRSSWLRSSQGSALGPAKPDFMELLICFMDINSFVCPNLLAHWEEVACKGSCSSLHRWA